MISEKSLKSMCNDAGVKKGIYENPRFLFTIQQVSSFYFSDNIGVNDISEGFVDGCGDGGIDYIYKNDDGELFLIQGKTQNSILRNGIHNVFDNIIRTIEEIKKNDFSNIKPSLAEKMLDVMDDVSKIYLVLFYKNKLKPELKDTNEYQRKGYEIVIYDKEDIENQVFMNDPNKKVDDYTLDIDSHNNVLRYSKNGFIVNVSANSIKKLYNQKKFKGLFSYNLREKINGIKVDKSINETIDNDSKNFWYKNNGLTIGCEKCEIKNNTIHLKNFSIINGAQTTTNIGMSKKIVDGYDFYVLCKVVVAPYKKMELAKKYLQDISIATNYQKSINLRDTRANSEEQQKLRNGALANDLKLDIKIKRSTEIRPDSLSKWQHIDNLTLGQIILSCIFQNPGSAKASKNSLMDTYYDKVYNTEHNYNLYYDLVMLYNKYLNFRNDFKKNYNSIENGGIDINGELYSIIQEGMWSILASVCLLLKIKGLATNPKEDKVGECRFKNRIFSVNSINEISPKIDELFKYIAETINQTFKDAKEDGNVQTNYSSYFLKNNTNYTTYIKERLKNVYNSTTVGKQLRDYLDIFKS